MWTEKTPAEDTPGRECSHDVVGLRPHKGTMWMSNDRSAFWRTLSRRMKTFFR